MLDCGIAGADSLTNWVINRFNANGRPLQVRHRGRVAACLAALRVNTGEKPGALAPKPRSPLAGAHASANLYSLLQSCMVNGIDTWRYLRDLLIALAQAKTVGDYVALLPWRLAKPIEVNAGQLPRHNT